MANNVSLINNTWSLDKVKNESNNYNHIMNRVWYCVASSDFRIGDLEVFWFFSNWVKSKEGKNYNTYCVTKKIEERAPKDYGVWEGQIGSDAMFHLRPMIKDFGIRVPLLSPLHTHWLQFSISDSYYKIWTFYLIIEKKPLFFIFSDQPNLINAYYQEELIRLHNENKINLAENQLYKLHWHPHYKIGSAGEDKIKHVV